jgi:hypothetical protein
VGSDELRCEGVDRRQECSSEDVKSYGAATVKRTLKRRE